ncbi:MAG: EF-hand domain-containing protein [Roseomonas sp.]|nr:EF-hand domain-containing protein [Roseomonas sp.]
MSSRTTRTLILASVFALGTVGLARAQPGPQGMPSQHMHQMHHGQRGDGMMGFAAGEAFARADTNNDGKVTREEANAWLAARFAEIDANKDGGLTLEEIRAFYTARRGEGRGPPEAMRERMDERQAARFRFVDADLDGKISLPELRVMADAMFRSMDADGDGALTRAEVQRRGRRGDGPRAQPPGQPAPR